MQTFPSWRATTAAWAVLAPLAVRKPAEAWIPEMSSGEGFSLTRITCPPSPPPPSEA